MRYWWVNQNQTFAEESGGSYLWSPKRNANGARNRFYDNMRVVAPGDIVFSFVDTCIKAIGFVQSYCYEAPKPEEFGSIGENWSAIGWRVNVGYHVLKIHVRPKDHMDRIRGLLPDKYSPLTGSGNGLQSVYLAEIGQALASSLVSLVGHEATALLKMTKEGKTLKEAALPSPGEVKERWESQEENKIRETRSLSQTEKSALVRARVGQGLFREELLRIERQCRVTRITNPRYLIAGHIKPWRHSSNDERLDGENGLMLCPNIDLLFDRGFISFEDKGDVIVSPVADQDVLRRMSLPTTKTINVGGFTEGQKRYLAFHRNDVLLQVTTS